MSGIEGAHVSAIKGPNVSGIKGAEVPGVIGAEVFGLNGFRCPESSVVSGSESASRFEEWEIHRQLRISNSVKASDAS